MARLYKYIKSTLVSILETKDKTKLQNPNFPLTDNKNINYYTLWLGKVKFFTSLYTLFSYFIDSSFKTVFTNNFKDDQMHNCVISTAHMTVFSYHTGN